MAIVQPIRRPNSGLPKQLKVILAILLVVIAAHVFIDRLYEYRLHAALGYGAVYATNMVIELATRYIGAVIYAMFGMLAIRPLMRLLPEMAHAGLRLAGGVLGWLIGYSLWSLDPTAWLTFFNHAPFHRLDPILHMDESFYVYLLPILNGLIGRLVFTLVLFAVPRVIYFFVIFAKQQFVSRGAMLPDVIHRQARVLCALVAAIFVCFAVLAVLGRYDVMLNPGTSSFLFGPDYVTVHLTLPIFTWLHAAALLLVALSLVWLSVRIDRVLPVRDGFVVMVPKGLKRPLQAGVVFVVSLVLGPICNGLVNTLYVHPNQNIVELPFIKHSIDATRWALGIEHVNAQPFQPATTLTAAGVNRDQNALDNVRVNDQGQTTSIYNQLQSFKSYFEFSNSSVDRYGNSQVYVSARQMNVDNLPVQTWVNRTLVYTHGYGVAASPVNQFDQDGLPTLWAKNTPQQTTAPFPAVTRPQIYFGTMNNSVIAPSKQPEFDYPVASEDHSSTYAGGYGLPIFGNRWLLAIEQKTLRFYTTDQLTNQSLWLFDRDIYQRVQDIAPFLTYDQDVFPFVDGAGHVKWMLDAYTQTPNIPYAQTSMNTSYIRNSVKVVMDAYTGQTTFYVINKDDPMVQTLMRSYPTLFTANIPADIRAHFRYPKDLFNAQATALLRYHMTDPSAFYNQEDLWAIANQIYAQNQTSPRPPVYQMIRMPDQTFPHFVISALFTPATKDNLNGWFIADNEPGSYGKLTLYQFPQSSWINGPMQAENQIDANPTIAAQLTLWNQQGSQVVRGDLLLVPVGDALLYVEPVYLVANRQNSLPQLQRVIIDFNQRVYIDTSLGSALQDLLTATGGAALAQPGTAQGPGAPTPNVAHATESTSALAHRANQLLAQYESDTAKGDFVAAGNDLKQLGALLSRLSVTPGTIGASTRPSVAAVPGAHAKQ